MAPPTSYSVVYILFFHELWINCSPTKPSADFFFLLFSQRASSLRSSETSCWRSCSLTGEWRGGRKYFQVSLWRIWTQLCSESSSSFSFSVCAPLIPRPSQIVRCEQRRCELLYSLKKADFINERVTCGAFYDCGFSILLFLTLSSCLRRLFQSHDGCGCWRCGRIPELLPDRTGHNEEATLLNRLSNLHPRHTCSHCNNLVDLQVELLFTAEGWLLTQYNVMFYEHSSVMTVLEMWLVILRL